MSPSRRPRVLAIDDEALIRRVYERFFRDAVDVVVVEDGEAARLALDSDRGFDAVFCDVQMPRMSGTDLYRHVMASQPSLAARFVFVTGNESDADVLATGQPWLRKPFPPQALFDALARVLGG